MHIIPCSICVCVCVCFLAVMCISAPFLQDDLLQEIAHVVVEYLDFYWFYLCLSHVR